MLPSGFFTGCVVFLSWVPNRNIASSLETQTRQLFYRDSLSSTESGTLLPASALSEEGLNFIPYCYNVSFPSPSLYLLDFQGLSPFLSLHFTHVEVRGQLVGVVFLFPPCGLMGIELRSSVLAVTLQTEPTYCFQTTLLLYRRRTGAKTHASLCCCSYFNKMPSLASLTLLLPLLYFLVSTVSTSAQLHIPSTLLYPSCSLTAGHAPAPVHQATSPLLHKYSHPGSSSTLISELFKPRSGFLYFSALGGFLLPPEQAVSKVHLQGPCYFLFHHPLPSISSYLCPIPCTPHPLLDLAAFCQITLPSQPDSRTNFISSHTPVVS